MLGALFVSLFIGFSLSETFQPITDADAVGWSGMLTGIAGSAMGIMHQRGVLFRTPPSTEDDIKLADSTASLAVQLGALGYVGGYSVFFGVGPVIGLVLLARSALKDGRPNSIIALPILLTFSVVNLLVQAEIGTDDQRQTITGLTLAVQGVILTMLSARDDLVYDYENLSWDDDEAFFAFMDRLGVSGALYTIIGLFVTFDSVNLDSIAYLLTTVYLVVIGIQGFSDEADARWRRGVGGYGSILTAFLFANSLESDIYNAIGIVMTGMVALGFGFLFMQRMNEEDGIYESTEHEAPQPFDGGPDRAPAMVDLDDEDAEEDDDDLEVEGVDDTADVDTELKVEDELHDEVEESVEEEASADETVVEEETLRPLEEEKRVSPVEEKPTQQQEHNGLLDTGEGFALRLPKDAVQNILTSLESTPHDGYVPVVAFGPNGQIMLTFEAENSNA